MHLRVTGAAQGNQVRLAVSSALAAMAQVVHLELLTVAALLASPAVPLQDLPLELPIRLGRQPIYPIRHIPSS